MKTPRLVVWLNVCALTFLSFAWAASAQPDITPEYFSILRGGDSQELREALDHGAPVNVRDAQGNTPLMLAAVYADTPCVQLLLEGGAEINATNALGATPLMRAAHNYGAVRLLVERGADVNARSALGNSALLLAARTADAHRTVEFLLAHGADANATNNWGASALMAATASGDDASVRLLLQRGANANAQPAADHVGFILGGARSPLMWAAFRGDTTIMQRLLDAGADANSEGFFGTPLSQAAWADQTKAVRLLLKHGAEVNQKSHGDRYAPLHWAASSERGEAALVKLLLKNGANPDVEGGESIEAFMDIPQTPLMLAKRRGETSILAALTKAGATNETPDELRVRTPPVRQLPGELDSATLRDAIRQALAPLQETSIISKQSFVNHVSRQDCTSCHQQYMPLAAIGGAKKIHATVDIESEQQLVAMVRQGELKNLEADWEPIFHPDGAYTKGYTLFGYASAELPADELTDSAVHHLAAIQGRDGCWFGNLPRPPMQTSDVGATALGIQALQSYPLPGRKAEFSERVDRARHWLWTVKPANNEERVFQILGLAWAGEPAQRLQSLAKNLSALQRNDGGWSQLPAGQSDAYATGQAVYALRLGAGFATSHPAVDLGRRYLLTTQLEDGTWYVRRRAFPFQPTMQSGFPHGKDSWISAAATSWAVLALSLPEERNEITGRKTTSLASQTK